MREITDKVQYQTENEFHIELTQWERNHITSSPSRRYYCTSQQDVNKSEHSLSDRENLRAHMRKTFHCDIYNTYR